MTGSPQYSIVVPVYNSAATLAELVERLVHTFENLGEEFEIILVDDRSTDDSWEILKSLKEGRVRGIRLKENSGQIAATTCGMANARGKFIFTLDDDLQYPPEELPKLIAQKKKTGAKIVFGDPEDRKHGPSHDFWVGLGKFFFHSVFMRKYRKINFFTTLRLMDRELFQEGSGKHLFYLWEISPKQMSHIQVRHEARKAGSSGYSLTKLVRYYRPFILYMTKNTIITLFFLFLPGTLFFWARYFLHEIEKPELWSSIFLGGTLLLLLIGSILHTKLKKGRKVNYQIEELTE
ncbi:MAG: glycosyltransferase family 2 protein [Bacteroidia bacterium]|nr:glycosyltransferase family 2 protein [Bacteroidia bacterium]